MSSRVTITRRAAWVLIVAAAWTFYVWVTRIRIIAGQNQTTSFKVVHYILAGISLVFAAAIAAIGIRAVRGPKS